MRRASNLVSFEAMQRRTLSVGVGILGASLGLGLGCGGGGGANGGAPAAVPPAGSAVPPAAVDNGAPPANPGPTTTTTAVSDGGGTSQGTKLTDTTPSPAGSAPAVPKGHTHDAGRGTDDIRAIVIAHRDEARACYDRALADHPGIEGDIVLQWTIDPKGGVTQVVLDQGRSKITEPSVVGCITGIIQRIQFAASPGGFETKASYPFNFHPHHVKQP
jgi:hypothetical protein